MARPIYHYELDDPDFSWLIASFRDSHPSYVPVESNCLPIILIDFGKPAVVEETQFPIVKLDPAQQMRALTKT